MIDPDSETTSAYTSTSRLFEGNDVGDGGDNDENDDDDDDVDGDEDENESITVPAVEGSEVVFDGCVADCVDAESIPGRTKCRFRLYRLVRFSSSFSNCSGYRRCNCLKQRSNRSHMTRCEDIPRRPGDLRDRTLLSRAW